MTFSRSARNKISTLVILAFCITAASTATPQAVSNRVSSTKVPVTTTYIDLEDYDVWGGQPFSAGPPSRRVSSSNLPTSGYTDLSNLTHSGKPFKTAQATTQKPAPRPNVTGAKELIPYVATRTDTVEAMLWLGEVSSDDIVYDLGSGDGRICIAAVRDFGARGAVGIENDPELIAESRKNAEAAGVADRVTFIEGDLFEADISEATVVTLSLGHSENIRLRPKLLRTLQPDSYIVSHLYSMGEWPPERKYESSHAHSRPYSRTRTALSKPHEFVPGYEGYEVPDYKADSALAWKVPAGIAGVWKGTRDTENGPLPLELVFHQSLVSLNATGKLLDRTEVSGHVTALLRGTSIRLDQNIRVGESRQFSDVLEGNVDGNSIAGTAVRVVNGSEKTFPWRATRQFGDLTGNWAWDMVEGGGTCVLEIQEGDNTRVAHVQWGGSRYPVYDFYDFGGGFYFTIPLQQRYVNSGHVLYRDGYLVGEAILRDGTLEGTIVFYPASGVFSGPQLSKYDYTALREEWKPVRIAE